MDQISVAERMGADGGLDHLGEIDTRLISGALASHYSAVESNILSTIKEPVILKSKLRSMLRQEKKTLLSFEEKK